MRPSDSSLGTHIVVQLIDCSQTDAPASGQSAEQRKSWIGLFIFQTCPHLMKRLPNKQAKVYELEQSIDYQGYCLQIGRFRHRFHCGNLV